MADSTYPRITISESAGESSLVNRKFQFMFWYFVRQAFLRLSLQTVFSCFFAFRLLSNPFRKQSFIRCFCSCEHMIRSHKPCVRSCKQFARSCKQLFRSCKHLFLSRIHSKRSCKQLVLSCKQLFRSCKHCERSYKQLFRSCKHSKRTYKFKFPSGKKNLWACKSGNQADKSNVCALKLHQISELHNCTRFLPLFPPVPFDERNDRRGQSCLCRFWKKWPASLSSTGSLSINFIYMSECSLIIFKRQTLQQSYAQRTESLINQHSYVD